jgi:hypothetical protein
MVLRIKNSQSCCSPTSYSISIVVELPLEGGNAEVHRVLIGVYQGEPTKGSHLQESTQIATQTYNPPKVTILVCTGSK